MKNMRALSIRQPYAEQILRGKKKVEYRSRPTNIRGRVYIYAGMNPGVAEAWEEIKLQPGNLPTGVLVGTVEIKDCTGKPGDYEWHLAKPERLKRNLKPKKHPLLGHKDLRMAARYQHLSPAFLADAVNSLDAVFGDLSHQSVTIPKALPAAMSVSA